MPYNILKISANFVIIEQNALVHTPYICHKWKCKYSCWC